MGNCLLLLGLKREKRYEEVGYEHGPVTLLLVGLDSAGKTTAAKGIVGDPVEDVAPTVGFAPEYLEYRGCEVTIYDLGGGAKIRPVWAKYFSEVHGVIFVVDSTAGARLAECEEVLISLLADPKIAGKPVLILANKQDVEGAMDEIDLVEGLKVEEIVNRFKCPTRVETCSALATRNRKPDKPIADGFRWLVDTIVVHYKEINARVTKDLERERLKQRRELEERKERLKQLRAEREELAAASGAQRSEAPPRQAVSSATKRNSTSSSSSSSPPSPISSFPSSPRASSGVTKAEVVVRRDMEDREEEVVVKTSPLSPAASMVPNGTLPQGKGNSRHRTTAECQELNELGFESSGELGALSDSASSLSSASLIKDTAITRAAAHAAPQSLASPARATSPPHRVILVRESSPSPPQHHHHQGTTPTTASTTTTTTTTTSPSATSVASGGHHSSRLDLSSERRQSECIPIDSDDEMFDLPAALPNGNPLPLPTFHHHHHHHQHNTTMNASHLSPSSSVPPGSSAKTMNNSLELETASRPAKKKSFLKRYHKTAPLVNRDQEVPPQQA